MRELEIARHEGTCRAAVGTDALALCIVNRLMDCHGSGMADEPLCIGLRVAIILPKRFRRIVRMRICHAFSFEGDRRDLASGLGMVKLHVSSTWLARVGMQAVGQPATNCIDTSSGTISFVQVVRELNYRQRCSEIRRSGVCRGGSDRQYRHRGREVWQAVHAPLKGIRVGRLKLIRMWLVSPSQKWPIPNTSADYAKGFPCPGFIYSVHFHPV